LGLTVAELMNLSARHGTFATLKGDELLRVREWVRRTTNFNAFDRITSRQALAEWQAIWPRRDLDKLLEQVKVETEVTKAPKISEAGKHFSTGSRDLLVSAAAAVGGAGGPDPDDLSGVYSLGGACHGSSCGHANSWLSQFPYIMPQRKISMRGKLSSKASRRKSSTRRMKSPSRRMKSPSRRRKY